MNSSGLETYWPLQCQECAGENRSVTESVNVKRLADQPYGSESARRNVACSCAYILRSQGSGVRLRWCNPNP